MNIAEYLVARSFIEKVCYKKVETMIDEESKETVEFYSKMDFDLLKDKTEFIDSQLSDFLKDKYFKKIDEKTGLASYYKITGVCRDKSIYPSIYCLKLYNNFSTMSAAKRKPILKDIQIIDILQVEEETKWRRPFNFKKDDKHLYILKNEFGRIKIGVSMNMEQRVKAIESASGCKIEVLRVIENGFALETKLHKHFKSKRYIGEWFILNDTDINYLLFSDLKKHLII